MKSIKVLMIGVFTAVALFTMVSCNKTDLTDLSNSVADMKKQNDILLQLTYKLQASLDSVHNVVNQNNTLLNNINNKVSALQISVSALITNITTLSTKIDSVNININSVQLQLKTLTTQFQSLSSQISSVFSSIMLQIDSLSTQVNVNTTLINKLQAEYLTTQINVNTILLAIQTNNQLLTANNTNVAQIQQQLISLTNQYNNVITLLNQLINLIGNQTVLAGLNNGLVAYYPFTGNAGDSSGNGNHGTVNGATLASDRFGNTGKAYKFGTNKTISVNSPSTALNLQSSFSLSSWFRLDTLATIYNFNVILSKHDGDIGNDGWLYGVTNDSGFPNQFVTFWGNGMSSYVTTQGVVSISNWYHYVVTYDQPSNLITYFLNGIKIGSATKQLQVLSNNLAVTIGYQKSSYSTYLGVFRGSIDDIRIYNRALAENEIQYLATH